MFDVLQLHQMLVKEARPSGAEQTGIAKVLREMAAPYVDDITTDAMGNLICHKKGIGQFSIMEKCFVIIRINACSR